MTVTITRQVHLDLGMDGTFGHAAADVSAYVVSAAFNYGFTSPLEEVAAASTCALVLTNVSGGWWQDVAGGAFYELLRPGMWVRVQYTTGGSTYVRYLGRIVPPVRYEANPYGTRTIYITASDDTNALEAQDFLPALAQNVTVDTELVKVLQSGAIAEPYHKDVWILGASTLGVNTRLVDLSSRYEFDTGVEVLDYVGAFSGTESGTTAMQYIRELVASERGGRFWWDAPSGKFKFHNRHNWLKVLNSGLTLTDDDIAAADVSWGGGIINRVNVNYTLMTTGTAGGVVYAADNVPFMLKPFEEREFRVQFRDPDNDAIRVAVIDPILPVRGTDWIANNQPDGSWLDVTDLVDVFATFGADGAKIKVKNLKNTDSYITTLQLRGTPLMALNSQQASYADAASVSANGYYPFTINIPYLNNAAKAKSYAKWLVRQFKDATTRFNAVTVLAENNTTTVAAAFDTNVGDRITITEPWSGHDADYIVIGKQHTDSYGTHTCTLYLRPVSTIVGWLLGVPGRTELGVNTYLVH